MPEKKEALRLAICPRNRGPRGGAMCVCAECENSFSMADVQVDHIEPVVPSTFILSSWDEYISRLFCKVEGLQVLCKPCHQEKTNKERKERINNEL